MARLGIVAADFQGYMLPPQEKAVHLRGTSVNVIALTNVGVDIRQDITWQNKKDVSGNCRKTKTLD